MKQTLCMTCRRVGTSTCSWDRRLKPVKGWVAEIQPYRGAQGMTTTFHVVSCPQFLHDGSPPPRPWRPVTPDEWDYILKRLLRGDRNVDIAKALNVQSQVVHHAKQRLKKKGMLG